MPDTRRAPPKQRTQAIDAKRAWYLRNRAKVIRRATRWKKRHRKRTKEIQRKANHTLAIKKAIRGTRQDVSNEVLELNVTIVTKDTARNPPLLWMHNGTLHQEDTRSAQEVIRQWTKNQRAR
jgi:hypothetical protein